MPLIFRKLRRSKLFGGSGSASLSVSLPCTDILILFLILPHSFINIVKMSSEENKLEEIRKKIDEIDAEIVDLLIKRVQYAKQAKEEKIRMNKPVRDWQRENEVIEKWCARARRGEDWNLSEEMMKKIAELIIEYTLKMEIEEGNE